jgi:hypothetical protein
MIDRQEPAKRGVAGCGIMMFLLGAAAIAGGVFMMARWDAVGAAGKSGAVVLIVVGTLLAAPFVLLMSLRLAATLFFAWVKRKLGKAGAEMLGQTRAMYETLHDFRPATPADFEGLDRRYYEETAQDLAGRGFRHLGDLVDETIEETSGITPPIRVLVSADGTTMVALYHLIPPGTPDGAEPMLMCDVTTEFGDGVQLVTSNAEGADLMTPPPQIEKRQLPLRTPVPELLRAHASERETLAARRGPAGAAPVTVVTLDDAIQSERRQQALKNAFRKGIGYLDPAEVRRIAASADAGPGLADLAACAADAARRTPQGGGGGGDPDAPRRG